MNLTDAIKVSGIPVLIASLCCLSPVILVAAGIGSVGFAASLADTLYGTYKWYFRIAGLLALLYALIRYVRRTKGICTIDDARRRRNEIVNMAALTLLVGVVGYLVFLYGVVHIAGVLLAIWE